MTTISRALSQKVFDITRETEVATWLSDVDREAHGVRWLPLGGIDNNVHTVEVASDPALALVERPTNSIDALLELKARELGETASTPHEAAHRWWDVPAGGLSSMAEKERRKLADFIQVAMHDSGTPERPTITIQDQGMGQQPDEFPTTLLSLLASNKKRITHVMGVYNAGGAASYKFAKMALIASRAAPNLSRDSSDEIGVTVVRYNPLDAEKFKSGVYEYLADRDGKIIRLEVSELPDLPFGTYVKLVEYLLPKYARPAYGPKQSLWHLFHAALPDPALPLRIIEKRKFPGMKGDTERRVVTGLKHLLSRQGTADYQDERTLHLGEEGTIVLRYFVLNEETDPDAFTTAEQGLTMMLNGQRQITRDRLWLRRQLNLFFLYKRLVVLVDGTGLTSAAKRDVFASTRESSVDTPLTKRILDLVVQDLRDDEELGNLDELAKQKTLQNATRTTTERVKRQLAAQIGAYLKGQFPGTQGGKQGKRKPKRKKPTSRPVKPRTDDSMMLEIPDSLTILTTPLRIERGATEPLRLELNAKNGFLPQHANALSIVVGSELKDHVKVVSVGRLLGGRVRVTLEAAADAPLASSTLRVAVVVAELGVLLTADGSIEVVEEEDEDPKSQKKGGEPNVDVSWVGRDKWDSFPTPWNADTAGTCDVHREDAANPRAITKVEWTLNEAFGPFEKATRAKKLSEASLKSFRERYELPVTLGLFHQTIAETEMEQRADEQGQQYDVPDEYARGERARLATAVLLALEPDINVHDAAEVGADD